MVPKTENTQKENESIKANETIKKEDPVNYNILIETEFCNQRND